MKIKKYIAPSMKEALLKVKQDLGEEAVILKSKKVTKGGILDLVGKELIEVIAAVDEPDHPLKTYQPNFSQTMKSTFESQESWTKSDLSQLKDEIRDIKTVIRGLGETMKYGPLPENLIPFYQELITNGVEGELARNLIHELSVQRKDADSALLRDYLTDRIAQRIQVSEPQQLNNGRPLILALVGPTGVGKTTTIAKLATHDDFFGQKKVAFISADTYRIAAVEQLKTFASIADIDMEVVYTPAEMQKAIYQFQHKDLILIDTAGRSQNNYDQLLELKSFMESARPDEVHLVLSLTTRFEDILDIVNKFDIVKTNRIVFTKLDETTSLGTILNVAEHVHKPISYITNGQEVPYDIATANPKSFARMILGKGSQHD